jgi:hypothetical protein
MADVKYHKLVVFNGVKDHKRISPDRHLANAGFITHLGYVGKVGQDTGGLFQTRVDLDRRDPVMQPNVV